MPKAYSKIAREQTPHGGEVSKGWVALPCKKEVKQYLRTEVMREFLRVNPWAKGMKISDNKLLWEALHFYVEVKER